MPSAQLLTTTYISAQQADTFVSQMLDWNIPVLNKPGKEASPSKPLDLWDYPYYREDCFRGQPRIATIVDKAADNGAKLTHSTLKELKMIYIEASPPHYPFTYVLVFVFNARFPTSVITKDQLSRHLEKATDETKVFIKAVSPQARYRPTYWFFRDLPESLQGLSGTLNCVKSPDGREIRIERAFPKFSYIIYDSTLRSAAEEGSRDPTLLDSLNLTDLALLSVVAHLTERGYREELAQLMSKLPETNQPADDGIHNLSVAQLTGAMNKLYQMQRDMELHSKDYYALRRKITRTKGLVVRIREKCGGISDKNLFDIVCDDALTVIGDEISNSLTELETRFKGIGDSISAYFNQLSSHRTKKLQAIGHLLQSTAVTGIAYKIFADLLPTIPRLKTHLTSQTLLAILLATILGYLTFALLKRRVE